MDAIAVSAILDRSLKVGVFDFNLNFDNILWWFYLLEGLSTCVATDLGSLFFFLSFFLRGPCSTMGFAIALLHNNVTTVAVVDLVWYLFSFDWLIVYFSFIHC